jgi:hypothetical protein
MAQVAQKPAPERRHLRGEGAKALETLLAMQVAPELYLVAGHRALRAEPWEPRHLRAWRLERLRRGPQWALGGALKLGSRTSDKGLLRPQPKPGTGIPCRKHCNEFESFGDQ